MVTVQRIKEKAINADEQMVCTWLEKVKYRRRSPWAAGYH